MTITQGEWEAKGVVSHFPGIGIFEKDVDGPGAVIAVVPRRFKSLEPDTEQISNARAIARVPKMIAALKEISTLSGPTSIGRARAIACDALNEEQLP